MCPHSKNYGTTLCHTLCPTRCPALCPTLCPILHLPCQARPMPSFDAPYFTVPSDKPLTKAHTPKLATKRRQRGNM